MTFPLTRIRLTRRTRFHLERCSEFHIKKAFLASDSAASPGDVRPRIERRGDAMKLLVVDDSATMRKIIIRNLRRAGIEASEIVEASDGAEAWEQLDSNRFDLVFTDVNMPNMTGIELLDKIRASDEHKKIPVIMVTTESTQEAVNLFREKGASGCVAKPFSAEMLEDVVSKVI